jgi:hypothetical protein
MTGLGDAFGATTIGEFTTFGLANSALDRGEFAGCGIVATHADKTKGNVTMIAPLTTVLIMDSPGFIVVTLTAWFFTQNTCLPAALHPGSGCLSGVIPWLCFAGSRRYLRQQPERRPALNPDELP